MLSLFFERRKLRPQPFTDKKSKGYRLLLVQFVSAVARSDKRVTMFKYSTGKT